MKVDVQVQPRDWGYVLYFPEYGLYTGVADGESIKHGARNFVYQRVEGLKVARKVDITINYLKGWDG